MFLTMKNHVNETKLLGNILRFKLHSPRILLFFLGLFNTLIPYVEEKLNIDKGIIDSNECYSKSLKDRVTYAEKRYIENLVQLSFRNNY